MGGKQLGLAAWREKSGNSGAQVVTHPTALCKREGAINTFFMSFYQVVTHPTALCKREGAINTFFMGIISNKEVPLPGEL